MKKIYLVLGILFLSIVVTSMFIFYSGEEEDFFTEYNVQDAIPIYTNLDGLKFYQTMDERVVSEGGVYVRDLEHLKEINKNG